MISSISLVNTHLLSNRPKNDLFSFHRPNASCFFEDHKPFSTKANQKHRETSLFYELTLMIVRKANIC